MEAKFIGVLAHDGHKTYSRVINMSLVTDFFYQDETEKLIIICFGKEHSVAIVPEKDSNFVRRLKNVTT